ncbi:hypothetical protein ACIHCV_22210 [Streptomyces sp. NPDC051956]
MAARSVTRHTAKTHLYRVMSELAARAQAVIFACEAGLVRPADSG